MAFEVCPPFSPASETAAPVCGEPRASGPEKESAAPHRGEEQESEAAGDKPSLEGRRLSLWSKTSFCWLWRLRRH